MRRWWAVLVLVGVGLGWAGSAPAADEKAVSLTDAQRRVLARIFERHRFVAPTPAPPDADLVLKVEPTVPGGLYRLGAGGDLPVRLRATVRSAGLLEPVHLAYRVVNFHGRKVAQGSVPPAVPDRFGVARVEVVLPQVDAFGYYHVRVTAGAGEAAAAASCGVAVVYPFPEEPEPGSPFGLLAPPGTVSDELPQVCRRLGVAHLAMDWADGRHVANFSAEGPPPPDWKPVLEWGEGERMLDRVLLPGLAPTGLIRLRGAGADSASSAEGAEDLGLVGFLRTACVQHYAKTIRHWHVGRPGIGGHHTHSEGDVPLKGVATGVRPKMGMVSPYCRADLAVAYRRAVEELLASVRRTDAPVSLWVTASPGFLADVLTEGPVLAGADGVSLVLDADAAAPNLRSGAYRRSLDFGLQVARRLGAGRVVVGETGEDPEGGSPQRRAWKLVTRHVLSLAAGAERVFVAYGRGLPTPLPAATAYAWMTHLMEGTAYKAELWPDVPLLEAHLFAGPERRVAVVWSWAGDEPAEPDAGVLVFRDGSGLEAWDVMGRPVGIWKGRRLVVPLGEAPVFVVSQTLSAERVRERFRHVRIQELSPATLWIRGLTDVSRPGRARVRVWIQSHRPYRTEVTMGLLLPEDWRARQSKQQFGLDSGEGRELIFECQTPEGPASGPYAIEAVATMDETWVRRRQQVQVTRTPRRTIRVGHGLGDWEGIEPVRLQDASGETRAEVRTAWDEEFFYFASAVYRSRETYRGGRHAFDGDAVQVGWGWGGRADDDFGHRGRGRALPAGAFRDTDHLMAIRFGPKGPQVIRLRGPRVALRTHWPGNMDPWYGPVEGAKAFIGRDAQSGVTIYEAAIPIKALEPFRPQRGRVYRFGFRIGNWPKAPLEWARAAGTPDYLANPASFLPTSEATLPCRTRWLLVGPM